MVTMAQSPTEARAKMMLSCASVGPAFARSARSPPNSRKQNIGAESADCARPTPAGVALKKNATSDGNSTNCMPKEKK